jgi:DNA-binding NtrC family response regulator
LVTATAPGATRSLAPVCTGCAHELTIAVEVSSTLLAEGDQEHLGFTLRAVEPPRPASDSALRQAWPELSALQAQVGLAPLDTLLREGAEAVERRLLQVALRLAGGRVEVAARLLVVEPQALGLRLHRLDLDASGADDDPPVPVAPRRMN